LPPGVTRVLVIQLAISNIIVAIFNSLPGLPLDGGRVLAAAVWAGTRDRMRGILVAGWVGRVVALLTVVAALLLGQLGYWSSFGLAFTVLVALSLWQGASAAIRAARPGPPDLDLGALALPFAAVPGDTSLAQAQAQLAAGPRPDAVLAVADA